MRNIFLFIRRYFNLIMFLFLQGLSLYFIVSYSKYHRAAFGNTTNKITGVINKEYNKIEYYFQLRKTNDSLVKTNEVLYNKLRNDYNIPDSVNKTIIDTSMVDSVKQYKKFNYLNAKVVSNSYSLQNNFIIINGPNVKYFTKGMGVAGIDNSVVGIITEVDGDYATVMSLLHKDSRINGKLLKGKEAGTITWNGEQPNILSLINIPKSAKVIKGDTIVSGISAIFPRGMMIGTVTEVKPESANNNYKISLRSSADFYNLEYVYGIQSADAEPVRKLLEKAKASAN